MISVLTEDEIRQNLKDAGCDEPLIERTLSALRTGDSKGCSLLLESWRRTLLDEIHGGQKRLDCLDYLRFQLQLSGGGK